MKRTLLTIGIAIISMCGCFGQKMQELILEHKASKGIIISDHMYESVIGITDDLFLLRDGYTFPIKCREDLIHHGYILR